jgi:hypothetical protein
MVIAIEYMFALCWLADFCEDNNINFAQGHALYMKAIHGGKAMNDKIDSYRYPRLKPGSLHPLQLHTKLT